MANAAEGDTSNTNQAGGAGAGAGDAPQYLTAKDAEAMVAKTVNAALSSHLKRIDFGKMIGDAMASHQPKAGDDAGAGNGGGDGAGGQQAGQRVDPELLRLRRDQESLRKSLEAEQQARKASEDARRNERAVGDLRAQLSKHVRPEAVEVLVKSLRADIQFDDAGDPMLPVEGGGTTTIAGAVEAFAKSKGAEMFRPAPSQGGAGSARPQRGAAEFRTKPRDQWNDSDHEAYFAERVAKNGLIPG